MYPLSLAPPILIPRSRSIARRRLLFNLFTQKHITRNTRKHAPHKHTLLCIHVSLSFSLFLLHLPPLLVGCYLSPQPLTLLPSRFSGLTFFVTDVYFTINTQTHKHEHTHTSPHSTSSARSLLALFSLSRPCANGACSSNS